MKFVTPWMEGLKILCMLLHLGLSDKTDIVKTSIIAGEIYTSLHSV